MKQVGRVIYWLLLALVAAMSALCAEHKSAKDQKHDPDQIGNRDVGKGVNLYSIEKEIGLGREMAQEVERETKLADDRVVTEYVSRLGQNLVRNSDAKVPFTIKVIDSEEVNAFALPGGFMFVNTGLIMRTENEAELAAVLAHEISHVAARHGTRQASRAQLFNYGSIPLIFMGGWAGYAIRQAVSLAVPMGFMKFSRSMESEADMLGLQYLYKSGYDPTEFVNFFERIQTVEKKKPGSISRLFSTHPMTGDRIRAAQKEIQNDLLPVPQYVVDTSEFHEVRDRLTMLGSRRLLHSDPTLPVLIKRPASSVDQAGDDRPTLKRQ